MVHLFKLVGTYTIRLDGFRTPVILTVWWGPTGEARERYHLRASHQLMIPGPGTGYGSTMLIEQQEPDAADRYAEWYSSMLYSRLQQAMEDGRTPNEDWLIRNETDQLSL